MYSPFKHQQRGSALLAATFAAVITTLVVVSLLDWSLNLYRDAKRKQLRQTATALANSELEVLYQYWTSGVALPSAQTIATRLANTNVDGQPIAVTSEATLIGAPQRVFLDESDPTFGIRRTISAVPLNATGTYQDASGLRIRASVRYYSARVRAVIDHPVLGQQTVRLGRRFGFLRSSVTDKAIFYEGVMEFGAGSDMDITGDIQSNSSIYMGANTGKKMRVSGNTYFYDKYNGHVNPMLGQLHTYDPSGNTTSDLMVDPEFDRTLNDGPPDQQVAREEQVKKLGGKAIFAANISPEAVHAEYATATPTPYETVNDVLRSVIAPPPTTSGGVPIPEDPTVAANRMYNKASLVITVDENGVTFRDAAGAPVTGFNSAVKGRIVQMVDMREQKPVKVTTVDVGALKTLIESTDMADKYNGIVYIHDKGYREDPNFQYAVRLENAAVVPDVNSHGFVVASDNPVYIKGDFNNPGSGASARCAIMADAITLLSDGWKDANSTNSLNYEDDGAAARIASGNLTVNSALISGNSPTVDAIDPVTNKPLKSGGVQNLIRYLENWSNRSTTINGSIGQMYASKYFNTHLLRSWQPNAALTYSEGIYIQPSVRNLNFDSRLAENPPAGVPSSRLSYYRGDLFEW